MPAIDEPFYWTAQTGMVNLGSLSGDEFDGRALNISSDGSVVVGESRLDSDSIEAFRWSSTTGPVGLGIPNGSSYTCCRSPCQLMDRFVVGEHPPSISFREFHSVWSAFRWTQATGMVPLGVHPRDEVTAKSQRCQNDGSIVVGRNSTGLKIEAYVWDVTLWDARPQGCCFRVQISDLTGWSLSEATGVSSDGTIIVGWGRNPNGDSEAWLADMTGIPGFPGTIIPEPGTSGIVVITLIRRDQCRR